MTHKYAKYTGTNKMAKDTSISLVLGQDIYKAVTKGQWKLPKHKLVCTSKTSVEKSRTTMLNRLGHSEVDRFILELEMAIAKALQESSSFLSAQLVVNPAAPSAFRSESDHLDVFSTTLEG